MRQPGIEPGAQQWECWILPLNHWRLLNLLENSYATLHIHITHSEIYNIFHNIQTTPSTDTLQNQSFTQNKPRTEQNIHLYIINCNIKNN